MNQSTGIGCGKTHKTFSAAPVGSTSYFGQNFPIMRLRERLPTQNVENCPIRVIPYRMTLKMNE